VQGYLGQFANVEAAVAHAAGGTLLASAPQPKPVAPVAVAAAPVAPVQPAPDDRQRVVAALAAPAPATPAMPKRTNAEALLESRVSPPLTAADGRMPRLVALAADRAIQELPKFASLR
jgi:hypothetical protein